MRSALRITLTSDETFDERLPKGLQYKSSVHFTPVEVARCAARLLAPEPGMHVLDIGAGVGKFCIAAALAVADAQFVGVEWRPHLVEFATQLAREWSVSNVRFIHGDAFALDWSRYDAFYLFNPFGEQLFEHDLVLDRAIDLDPATYVQHVMAARKRLGDARVGTRIVTYHGYGAAPPPGYELVSRHEIGSDRLELWVKTRMTTSDHDPENFLL